MNTGGEIAVLVVCRNLVRQRLRINHRCRCSAGIAWLSLIMASSGAAAQETPADSAAATAGPPVATAEATGTAPGDIVVTATRQVSTVNKVPLSIAAFDQKALDARGARQVDDVLRFTPGVQFRRDISGVSQISIRGIQSPSGAATTGVYIDDTPIAARSIGFSPTTIYPAVFDLERVEVLRGPQGTLFGAGSAGGTVRFITPQPSLTTTSVYGRAEVATTKSGDPSFEAGIAVGTPIIADRVGIRLSAWQRRDGGYVDHVQRTTGQLRDKNSDWQDNTALRAALSLVPVERVTLTPSIYYQRTYQNDQQAYTEYVSDPKNGVFINNSNANAPFRATIRLPALNAVYDAGPVSITANTSYYHQTNNIQRDYSDFLPTLLGSRTTPERGIPGYPDYTNQTIFTNEQKVWSNELRVASQDPGWFTWVVGAFYQKQDQTAQQFLPERSAADFRRFVEGVTGRRLEAVFPVTSELVEGRFSTRNTLLSKESQVAGFGEATIMPVEHIKVILGARISHTKFDFRQIAEGPYTGVVRRESGGVQEESPFTPKIGFEYEFNGSNRLYMIGAKGFRAGGANAALTDRCNADLAAIGYSASPATFDSDTVWSYEFGSKNRLFGNKLSINASVYKIDWSNIQQTVQLRGCGSSFVANVGEATSRGFDVDAEVRPLQGLLVQLAIGYNQSTYDETLLSSPNAAGVRAIIVNEGDSVGTAGISPWQVAGAVQYDAPIKGDMEGYARADYQYSARETNPIALRDPVTSSYSPSAIPLPTQNYVTLRAGVRTAGVDVSVFINNLLDEAPAIARLNYGYTNNLIHQTRTLRPRTVGLTLSYRR